MDDLAVFSKVSVPHDATFAVLQSVESRSHNTDVVRVNETEFVQALSHDLRRTPSKESFGVAHPFGDSILRVPFDDGQGGVLDQGAESL